MNLTPAEFHEDFCAVGVSGLRFRVGGFGCSCVDSDVCLHIHIHIYIYTHICIYTYTYIYVYVYMYTRKHIYIRIYAVVQNELLKGLRASSYLWFRVSVFRLKVVEFGV